MANRVLIVLTIGAAEAVFLPVRALGAEPALADDPSPAVSTNGRSPDYQQTLHARLGVPLSLALDSAPPVESRAGISHRPVFGTATWASEFFRFNGYSDLTRANQLFSPARNGTLTLAYAWRGLSVESSASPRPSITQWRSPEDDGLRIPSRSTRFSYRPGRGLALQFSRGTWSSIDQLVADGEIKRTSLSATYTHRITGGEWQSTLAWGRNKNKGRPSVYGYLAETSMRLAGAHVAFARFEQVGPDDLPELSLPYTSAAKAKKLSVGYYQELYRHRGTRLGAGLMASRYLLPEFQSTLAGRPTSYMLFLRIKLQ